jgi:hypothetical protein
VFRDSRGVVHTVSSADPLQDLPSAAAVALREALLRPVEGDLGGVLERCDAARELIERWQDAFFAGLPDEVDLAEEARWAAEAGMSLDDVEAQYDEEEDDDEPLVLGDLDDDGLSELTGLLPGDPLLDAEDEEDPRVLLPEELVAVLERELLLLPLRTRLEALVAAADLVGEWVDLLDDHEKLLGHLVLRHGDPAAPHDHESLADRHATLHALSGPGHAV